MRIICNINTKEDTFEDLSNLIENGMTDARFNFSHINYETSEKQIDFLKSNYPHIRIIQDLQGNKVRVSQLLIRELVIKANTVVYFATEEVYKNNLGKRNLTVIPLAATMDFSIITQATDITASNTSLKFRIIEHGKTYIKTIAETDGILRAEKGINVKGIDRTRVHLTDKDKEDILWGLRHSVDVICLSFVSSDIDIQELKGFITANLQEGEKYPVIWAKIESEEGVDNIKKIIPAVDGIMIGRGDLFAEVDFYSIPMIQDSIIKLSKKHNKEIIIATHVLDSMKSNQIPTLPELESMYTFINKKVDGFMLAIEVSLGKNPFLAVKTVKDMIDKYDKG